MADRVVVPVYFDAQTNELVGAQRAVGRVGNAAAVSAGKVGILTKALNTLKANAVIAGIAALYGAFRLLGQSVRDAGVQQIAERKLEQALKNTGEAGGEAAKGLKELAAETQRLSNFGDEAIITAQSMLLSFQEVGGARGAGMLTQSVVDMAAGLQKATGESQDLNQIAATLGKSLSQGAGALTRYGISLTDTQKAAFDSAEGLERVALLTEIVGDNFGGMAQATVDPMKQLKNSLGDLSEQAGGPFRAAMEEAAAKLGALAENQQVIAFFRQVGRVLGWLVNVTLQSVDVMADAYTRLAIHARRQGGEMLQGFGIVVDGFASLVVSTMQGVSALGPVGGAVAQALAPLVGTLNGIGDAAERMGDRQVLAARGMAFQMHNARSARGALSKLRDTSASLATTTETVTETATEAARALAGPGSLTEAAKDLEGVLERARKESQELSNTLRELQGLSPDQVRELANVQRALARQRAEIEAFQRDLMFRAGLNEVAPIETRATTEFPDETAEMIRQTTAALEDMEVRALDVSQNVLGTVSGLVNNYGDILSSAMGGMAALFDEMGQRSAAAFKVYQGIAIAQAVVDTYRAANVALASAPPPFNFIAMAGVIATGIANVMAISRATPGGGVTGTSTASRGTPARYGDRGASSVAAGLALGGNGGPTGFGNGRPGVQPVINNRIDYTPPENKVDVYLNGTKVNRELTATERRAQRRRGKGAGL